MSDESASLQGESEQQSGKSKQKSNFPMLPS